MGARIIFNPHANFLLDFHPLLAIFFTVLTVTTASCKETCLVLTFRLFPAKFPSSGILELRSHVGCICSPSLVKILNLFLQFALNKLLIFPSFYLSSSTAQQSESSLGLP